MKFLFHTIVPFAGNSVYYNVYHVSVDEFYFEVLDNPHKVTCESFRFFSGSLQCSVDLPLKEREILSDQLQSVGALDVL